MGALKVATDPTPLFGSDFDLAEVDREQDAIQEIGATGAYLGVRRLADIDRSAPAPLLLGRLDPISHTILYGSGGVGKGTLSAWWVAGLVASGQRVLIVDYENHPDEWARRYFGLVGVDGAGDVLHVAPLTAEYRGRRGAIWEQERELRQVVEDLAATYLVVDSIVPACGGADPMEPGTASRYTGALEYFGRPVLSLAHVTKADDLRYPYGSVFWHNLARVTWSLAKDGPRVVLTHRKGNNYANAGRVVVDVSWHDDLPREVREQGYTAVLSERIDEVLGDDGMTVTAIVRRLNEDADEDEQRVKPDSIRAALRRGIKAMPPRYTVDGQGDTATWRRV